MVLKKLSVSLLLLLALLTGCGGGGDNNAPNISPQVIIPQSVTQPVHQFNAPAIIPAGKLRLARIDYRFDTPTSSLNNKGHHTSSYNVVAPMIDNIKSIGFNGIIFTVQVSVNSVTGKISTTDSLELYSVIKTPPKDLWKLVDYAKSQGLKVWISLQISDSITDMMFTPNYNNYTRQYMFNNIIEFDKPIAATAQKHKVDGIFISECNWNMESDIDMPYWKQLADSIRTVFSGKLGYTGCLLHQTKIWNYVDYVNLILLGGLSKTPVTDLKSIVNLYHNDIHGQDQVAIIKNIHSTYGKKIMLEIMPKIADTGVGMDPPDFYGLMETGNLSATNTNVSFTNTMQLLKIQAFFEMMGLKLSDITDGIILNEFSPWLEDKHFSNPSPNNPVYYYYAYGSTLANNLDAQKTLNFYFSKPWGYATLQ
jgi:hypothetical protein